MSTRLKVFFIITGIVLAITLSSMVISIFSAQEQILKTLETNMEMLASAANEYVMGEMELIKADASAVTQALIGYPIYQLREILTEQVFAYENFKAIAMYSNNRKLMARDGMGGSIPPESVVNGEYGDMAFKGERVISTTFEVDSKGELVFYIFVPMDDYKEMLREGRTLHNPTILGITVSGTFFSEKITQLTKMNPSGRISILDKDGIIISDMNDSWVKDRLAFQDRISIDSKSGKTDAQEIEKIIKVNKSGTGRYTLKEFDGKSIENVTAFKPIVSAENWVIAVSTPVIRDKTYVAYSYFAIRGMIGLSGMIFMALGALAAALASGVIARPFELLKAAEKAKTAFIANMSYDLRTPLNAIIGFAQLSRSKELPPDIEDHQLKVFESGMTILGVVNDLLDISNIESKKFGIFTADFDLPGFISDTANSNLRHIGSKPVEFTIIPDDKLPAKLNGDSLRVRQIFNNLLSNCIRETNEGSVEWRVSVEKEGDTLWLVSSVSDTGGGIDPEDVDKLFLDYSSLDTQKMRSSRGGTGLGLALTKKIIDLMKGTIEVESSAGKGATFKVRLPHKYVNDELISAEMSEKLRSFSAGGQRRGAVSAMKRVQIPDAKVLVVDDMVLNIDVTRGMLEPYGLKVDSVMSGKEAIELIRKGATRYNAIFINHWMPEMSGAEAVRIIRNEIGNDYAKNIPIIAVVANAITGNNAFFMKSGYQSVISRPISIPLLDSIVRQFIVK